MQKNNFTILISDMRKSIIENRKTAITVNVIGEGFIPILPDFDNSLHSNATKQLRGN